MGRSTDGGNRDPSIDAAGQIGRPRPSIDQANYRLETECGYRACVYVALGRGRCCRVVGFLGLVSVEAVVVRNAVTAVRCAVGLLCLRFHFCPQPHGSLFFFCFGFPPLRRLLAEQRPGLRPTDSSIPLRRGLGRPKGRLPDWMGLTRIAHHHRRRLFDMAHPARLLPVTYKRRGAAHVGHGRGWTPCSSPLCPFIITPSHHQIIWHRRRLPQFSIPVAHPQMQTDRFQTLTPDA